MKNVCSSVNIWPGMSMCPPLCLENAYKTSVIMANINMTAEQFVKMLWIVSVLIALRLE